MRSVFVFPFIILQVSCELKEVPSTGQTRYANTVPPVTFDLAATIARDLSEREAPGKSARENEALRLERLAIQSEIRTLNARFEDLGDRATVILHEIDPIGGTCGHHLTEAFNRSKKLAATDPDSPELAALNAKMNLILVKTEAREQLFVEMRKIHAEREAFKERLSSIDRL